MTYRSNYVSLTPQSFLRRSAKVYPNKTAVIDGERNYTYATFYQRCCKLANCLLSIGIKTEDSVAVLAPNTSEHLEATFGVHMAGGVLVSINYRLSPGEIAHIINHSQSRVLIVDWEYVSTLSEVIKEIEGLEKILVVQKTGASPDWVPDGALNYEEELKVCSDEDPRIFPEDENQTISVNYTSGTTGQPKGVMYTHRSAYINATCNLLEMNMGAGSVYLWTLPMFHCNGWCYPWAVTAIGGTHVCLRNVEGKKIVETIQSNGITHFCGAPIVLKMIVDGAKEMGISQFDHRVKVSTAAAPPSPSVIAAMMALNVDVVHVYGLTETYGPTTVCEFQPDWKELDTEEMSQRMARQGVAYILSEDLQILDKTGNPVPEDGKTMGEVCMRGNIVMKGYFKNPEATAEALRDGWFHSGDLGVMHADGYIELRDRAKDIIISGGENISTIEVENTLYAHPAVQDVAVVSRPDEKWGEVPVAFVTLAAGHTVSENELIAFCKSNLAAFKAPKNVFFESLPRTSTGKVQKYVLREKFWGDQQSRIRG